MKRILTLMLAVIAVAASVSAQTVAGDRLRLVPGPCTVSTGSGAPNNANGANCDTYIDTAAAGTMYRKVSGAWEIVLKGGANAVTKTVDQGLLASFTATHTTATAGTVYGLSTKATATHTSGTMNSVQALFNAAQYAGTSAASPAVTSLAGGFFRTEIGGASPTGTVSGGRALYIDGVANFATGTPSVTFTNQYGLYVANQSAGSGSNGLTITNGYGIYVAAQSGATANYSIYTAGGIASFNRTTTLNGSGATDPGVVASFTDASTGTTSTTSRSALSVAYTKSGIGTHTSWTANGIEMLGYLNAGSVAEWWGVLSRAQVNGASVTSASDFVADGQYGTSGSLGDRFGYRVRDWQKTGTQALTNQYGIYVPDLTSASGNNFGISLNVSAGVNKYNVWANGTASNVFNGNVGTSNFVSQAVGWQVSSGGAADFRYVYTDELHAKAFIADLEQALAGGQIIAKSVAKVYSAFTCPNYAATQTLYVEDLPGADDMQVFQTNDYVVLRSFTRSGGGLTIADCVGVVSGPSTAPTGYQSWTFTRAASGSPAPGGTMNSGTVIPVEAIVIDYGVSGNGYYEVNAVDGAYAANSPYMQIVTWNTTPIAQNRTVRLRTGKLLGITSVNEYGLIAGSFANNAYVRASDQNFDLAGITARWYDGATNVITISPGGGSPYIGVGNPAPSTYGSGAGVWMGKDTTYKFRVGDPAGAGIFWDGTNLLIGQTSTATAWTVTTGQIASQNIALVSGAAGTAHIEVNGGTGCTASGAGTTNCGGGIHSAPNNTAIVFWAGDDWAHRASAEFWVNSDGYLTALKGVVGGWALTANALKASSGTVGLDSTETAGDDIRIWAGNATPSAAPFRVTEAGVLAASSGTVGGWYLGSTFIGNAASNPTVGMVISGTTVRFWAGSSDVANAPFRVYENGSVYASSITLSGYVAVGGAAADINGGETTISGGKIAADTLDVSKIHLAAGSLGSSGDYGIKVLKNAGAGGWLMVEGETELQGAQTTSSADEPLVWSGGQSGRVYRKSDVFSSGATAEYGCTGDDALQTIVVESGLIVSDQGGKYKNCIYVIGHKQFDPLKEDVDTLKQEVASLRALVNSLIAKQEEQ